MKPETVLGIKHREEPTAKLQEWLNEYAAIAAEFPGAEDLAQRLSKRAEKACELITERNKPEPPSSSCDDMYYIEMAKIVDDENASLNGDFPLGNETDASFAGCYFSVSELAEMQCGLHHLIVAGNFNGYNFDVLVRKGFLAELYEDWPEAVHCYEGVPTSKSVQEREYECRRKMTIEGKQCYEKAQEYMESGKLSEVFAPLSRAADMGNPDAMTDLALARVYGQYGCAKDLQEALTLLRAAAKKDNARACFALCHLHDSGVYDVQAAEAKEMCEKAAGLGDEKAKARLADGFDLRPIREILLEQIEKGNIDALWQMAQLCKKENDENGAAEWFNKAIEAGQIDALLSAAAVYLDKNSGFYNKEPARQYLRRAADGGSVQAIILLADLELTDTDISFWQQAAQLRDLEYPDKRPKKKIKEQHKKQMAWYRLAAEAGDTDAMNALSMAYHLGYPETRDDREAFLWASRAADAGDGSAMYQTAHLYENGFGTDRDIDAALLLYTEAAEQGVRSAMIRLYEIYTEGLLHIQPDGKKATHYLWLSGEGRD